jgi:hypothetical protein
MQKHAHQNDVLQDIGKISSMKCVAVVHVDTERSVSPREPGA